MRSFLFEHYIYPLKELHYFFTYPIINFVKAPQKTVIPIPTKGTIVIVECWFQPNSYHAFWQNYLEKKGFKTHLITFCDMNQSFEETAKKLDLEIRKLKIEKFTLVGISTGAIVCLEYLYAFEGWAKVKRFISVAGPLHGSFVAWFIAFSKKGRDMIPGSKFLKKLELRPMFPDKMVTLSASHDEYIPLKNSIWEGIPSRVISVYGHNFFHLDHKSTYDLIASLSE